MIKEGQMEKRIYSEKRVKKEGEPKLQNQEDRYAPREDVTFWKGDGVR